MKKRKWLKTAVVTMAFMTAAASPAYALNLSHWYGGDSTEIQTGYDETLGEYRFAVGHNDDLPGWLWHNGYCYYFTDPSRLNKITNGTTPDGYTVDEQGRWTQNGEPVYNGYGTIVIGTDELYAGKNDDERWEVMRGLLEETYAKYFHSSEDNLAMFSTKDSFRSQWPLNGTHIIHNSASGEYIYLGLHNDWCDSPEICTDYLNEITERTIKILCGDHVGQELFDDLRRAAEPAEGGPGNIAARDENGNPIIYIDEEGSARVKLVPIDTKADGINFNYFDLEKWNSRTTDYGKQISIKISDAINESTATKTPQRWELNIR